ncbi:splicing regulatory glutamine/lysine-rich protein 1-like [Procambarus clarkii]|uniref:splicing regulatory glutamine/lysine-rich protein 1-like n=1 Tax=Procambarus clarkii TaxID=6728 RepID=UPI0037439432
MDESGRNPDLPEGYGEGVPPWLIGHDGGYEAGSGVKRRYAEVVPPGSHDPRIKRARQGVVGSVPSALAEKLARMKTKLQKVEKNPRKKEHRQNLEEQRQAEMKQGQEKDKQLGQEKDKQHGQEKDKQHGQEKNKQHGQEKDKQYGQEKEKTHKLENNNERKQEKEIKMKKMKLLKRYFYIKNH